MFAELNSDINPLKSGLLHLTGQPVSTPIHFIFNFQIGRIHNNLISELQELDLPKNTFAYWMFYITLAPQHLPHLNSPDTLLAQGVYGLTGLSSLRHL
jgi:hypothetical protein